MDGLSDQWSALESLLYRTEVFGLVKVIILNRVTVVSWSGRDPV